MLRIEENLCDGCGLCVDSCPFNAISKNGGVSINAACKFCGLCLKICPQNAIIEDLRSTGLIKSDYKDILVYAEQSDGDIASVSLELIGKAQELAKSVSQQVCCLYIGDDANIAEKLLEYGVAKVYAYVHKTLKYFKADVYSKIFYDCVQNCKPSVVLIGSSSIGRSLAPRVATRCKTGLTADCTSLSIEANTDLIQTRPAFGGNIMAQITTRLHRPQFATVRAKIMDMPIKQKPIGTIQQMPLTADMLQSGITLSNISELQLPEDIDQAQALVVAGNAIKNMHEMEMLQELAFLINGRVAATRPVVEAGLANHTMQIGLSGRTVRPQLIITCGVSGSVQFIAGMKASQYIFAINNDADAAIMKIANYAAVGDIFEIIPALIKKIKQGV